MNPELWNLLHDGSIERIAGKDPGDLTLLVGVDYLRERCSPTGTGFIVQLRGVSRFEFRSLRNGEERPIADLSEIAALDLEILSATVDEVVSVCCEDGMLTLVYDTAEVSLDGGQRIALTELAEVAARYWNDRERRKGKPRSSPPGT